jgi:poly-gamma-glutamate synthesis protein (capsule biosynthesis protein)
MKRRQFLDQACTGLLGAWGLAAGSSVGFGFAPLWAATRQPAWNPVTLFLAGDVMLGRGVDQVLPHPGNPHLDEASLRTADQYVALAEKANGTIPRAAGFDYIWGDALQELEAMAPAVRLVNLETSVTTSADAWPGKPISYRMNPANLPVLKAARIDGFTSQQPRARLWLPRIDPNPSP